ncbi:hypothetical protein ACA910_016821 [Epithemia clementina (nom. ined.)]
MTELTATLVAQSIDVPDAENFYQGCSFSPDGLCVLTSTAGDSKLRLYNTPDCCTSSSVERRTTTASNKNGDMCGETTVLDWKTALVAQGGDTVRSYSWYPYMNSTDPATCCFLATCRDQSIHLFDAYTGSIRASYRPYNALDEMESPTVVKFSSNGKHIFAGGFRTDRCIHVFDLSIPGRDSTVLRLGKTRRSSDGQKGLVSAITGAPDGRIFCVGTYAPGSIYVYDDRASEQPSGTVLNGVCVVGHGKCHSRKKRRFVAMEEENVDEGTESEDAMSIFSQARSKWFHSRAQGGVTQLLFAPAQDYILYSASRRSDTVLSWDLRMLSGNPEYQSEPVRGIRSFATCSDTNQRLEFDLDGNSNRLFVGGLDHCVRCYDTKSGKLLGALDSCFDQAVNGVSFHQFSSSSTNDGGILAAATGARHFPSEEDFENGFVNCQQSSPGRLHLFRLNA